MSTDLESQLNLADELELYPIIKRAIRRDFIQLDGDEIIYQIHANKRYRITDPEEKVRAATIAFLVIEKGYEPKRLETEVLGSHDDYADIVLYADDRCTKPWLVVENKKANASEAEKAEGEGQAFANAIALGAKYTVVDIGIDSQLWQVEGFGARERSENRIGDLSRLPTNYSEEMVYGLVAGTDDDIKPSDSVSISIAIKRAHAVIWAGGRRDPLSAFDEWSKLMFAKVRDERHTPNGKPRRFQIGVEESDAAVATRIHELFEEAKAQDLSIFPHNEQINLPDSKVAAVVRVIQGLSFIDTDSDIIGNAFEDFFGSVFRGNLGQYFTMRTIARFIVGMLRPTTNDYILDPTCGSGGFLLESLLQVWRQTDADFSGQPNLQRIKTDFALQNVYGIEIHPTLARICKISLLLHHDGHTNIEADKSCLSPNLSDAFKRRDGTFDILVGNPPFGTKIEEGDEDQLDGRSLSDYEVSRGRRKIQSEQLILERSIHALKPGGKLGLVLPDGILNNSGSQSNCPTVRQWLFTKGRILGVISLPDYAFRRSRATNKTSILVFEKFTNAMAQKMAKALERNGSSISAALRTSNLDYDVFFAEADFIGYTPSGRYDPRNDLYVADANGFLDSDQDGSILGSWRNWIETGVVNDPRCVTELASKVWESHSSHRIDPKYFVYQAHANEYAPENWTACTLASVIRRRRESPNFEADPMKEYKVLTLAQTGQLRLREAGVGTNPPEWLGMYFADSSSRWYQVHEGDIVYSGIDLWKGVVCYVTEEFDGALVTQEYPILTVTDNRIDPEFLRSFYAQNVLRKHFALLTQVIAIDEERKLETLERCLYIIQTLTSSDVSLARCVLHGAIFNTLLKESMPLKTNSMQFYAQTKNGTRATTLMTTMVMNS